MLRSGKSLKISTSYNVQQDDSATPNGTTSLVALLKQEEEEESRQRGKKFSVLAKVKQRARKWRQTLNKKRDRHPPPDNSNSTLSWPASFHDDDDGDDGDGPHEEEDDAEIFRTPRHEFEREAEEQKETASSGQHLVTTTFTLRDVLPKEYSDDINEDRILPHFLDKASTEAIASETESLADHVVPPFAAHPESAAAGLSISGTCQENGISNDEAEKRAASPGETKLDKGDSVKEYLVDKLKPGEDDRALSRAISGAINPSSEGGGGGGGLIHKLRTTVSSLLLRKEEPPSSSSSAAANSDLAEKSGDRQTS